MYGLHLVALLDSGVIAWLPVTNQVSAWTFQAQNNSWCLRTSQRLISLAYVLASQTVHALQTLQGRMLKCWMRNNVSSRQCPAGLC